MTERDIIRYGRSLLRQAFGQDRDIDHDGPGDEGYLNYAVSTFSAEERELLAAWLQSLASRHDDQVRDVLLKTLMSEFEPAYWTDLDGGPGKGPAAMARYIANALRRA